MVYFIFTGLGEAISFSVSSLLPPSPIPINSALGNPPEKQGGKGKHRNNNPRPQIDASELEVKEEDTGVGGAGGRRRSKRIKMAASSSSRRAQRNVDIVMTSPDVAEYVTQ